VRNRVLKAAIWFLVLLSCLLAGDCRTLKATVRDGSSAKPLLFIGNEAIPPMIYRVDGRPLGLVVDLVQALTERMPQTVRCNFMDWSKAQEMVQGGRADALIQINPTEERRKLYDFSEPLLDSEFSILKRFDNEGVDNICSLRGLDVGVEEKGLSIQILSQDPAIRIVHIPDIPSGFKMLEERAVDAVVVDRWVGLFALAQTQFDNIRIACPPINRSSSAIAVKKGNTKLLGEINAALSEIKSDGTYARILSDWKPKQVVFRTREEIIRQKTILTATLCVLLTVLLSSIFLVRQMRVRKRVITELEVSLTQRTIADQQRQLALDAAGMGWWHYDPVTKISSWDDRYKEIFGVTEDSRPNEEILKRLHPEDLPGVWAKVEAALNPDDPKPYMAEYRIRMPDGVTKWIEAHGVATFEESDQGRKAVNFVGTVVDITERKRTNSRLELLTTVSQRLLQAENPQVIVEELCRMVMDHIDCQFFFNYLVDIPGQRMHLNACAGIPLETAETIRKLDFGVAVCGCVARDGERIIAENILCSDDIRTELVKSFGVQAYCCHPIRVKDELIGTLSFGTRSRERFTADEVALMKTVTDKVAVAMERLIATQALREREESLKISLAEKEVLLREIHHRVKNNMQVVSSLVDLQADEVKDPAVRAIFDDVMHRIRSMAMVHEKLYQADDFSNVDFADYARGLLGYLWRAHESVISKIELKLDLEPVFLPVNAAVPCGLILNELFINALKHAFIGRTHGIVTVTLRADSQIVTLSIQDNGKGLPPEMELKQTRSLGLRLVQMLSKQLRGSLTVDGKNGTAFTIVFERTGSALPTP
jgi:PAS domain S-box-containing protein